MAYTLYGNGVDYDTDALQDMIDHTNGAVVLPMPEVCYLIDRPLKLHSHMELQLPRYCTIRLADNKNCHLLEVDDPDVEHTDIRVQGGIWDCNNQGQLPNPFLVPHEAFPHYNGIGIFLTNIKHLVLTDMTIKDPTTFACTLDRVSYFTVQNIRFDFNRGNPRPANMDGIHLDGNCHYGEIRNLQGTCYDDLVALNADEGSDGPITHITVDGIYTQECHSAVRMLTVKNELSHIHITNVHGTFYQYCIGITKYYDGETTGFFDALVLDNIHASKSTRYAYLHINEELALHGYVYPLIFIEGGTRVKSLSIQDLYRVEQKVACSTVYVGSTAVIDNLSVRNCCVENQLEEDIVLFDNAGTVRHREFANNRISGGTLER